MKQVTKGVHKWAPAIVMSVILLTSLLTLFSKPSKRVWVEERLNGSTQSNDTNTSVRYSFIGVGDMMLGTNYPSEKYLPPNDGAMLLQPLSKLLHDADVTFGNLEGVVLTEGGTPKRCGNPDACYTFRMPNHYVNHFKNAGFDVLSVANNHVGDFGHDGRINTVKRLTEEGIKFAGLTNFPFVIFEVRNSLKVGFCAFAPNEGTLSINDLDGAKRIVRHLDSLCDIVMVSFHGGAEGAKHRHITRSTEYFFGENRGNPYRFARAVIDAGADIVFGHGPHVTRAVDLYKERFIAYSLGNFATYSRFNLKGVSGVAPIIKVFVNQKGEFQNAHVVSIKQINEGEPVIDSTAKALHEIIELTKTDVREAKLKIYDDGRIEKW